MVEHKGADAAKIRIYWSCYMAVYNNSLVVHKIIRYLALLFAQLVSEFSTLAKS
jgi:hypothetical protein